MMMFDLFSYNFERDVRNLPWNNCLELARKENDEYSIE